MDTNPDWRGAVLGGRLGLGALLLALAACGDDSVGKPVPDACARNGIVPPDLRDVERSGEGLVATTFGEYPAREPDWARAAGVLSILKEVWGRTKGACPSLPSKQAGEIDGAIAT